MAAFLPSLVTVCGLLAATSQGALAAGLPRQAPAAADPTATPTVLPLYGGFTGSEASRRLYYTEVTVGGQIMKVQVDTGSADFMLLSKLICEPGGANSTYEQTFCQVSNDTPLYDPHAKGVPTEPAKNKTGFGVVYGDGSSAKALVYRDEVTLGNLKFSSAPVGAVYSLSTQFEGEGISGILGLAHKEVSVMYLTGGGELPLFDHMVNASAGTLADKFTMCFPADGESEGKLALGGGETPDMQILPYVVDPKVPGFPVPGCKLQVGNLDLNNTFNTSYALIDSGTTGIILPPAMFEEVQRAVCSVDATLANETGLCHPENSTFNLNMVNVPVDVLSKFPTLTFTLNDTYSIGVPPAQYLTSVPAAMINGTENVRINTVHPNGEPTVAILGGVALAGHSVLFDRVDRRLGFVQMYDCTEYDEQELF